MICLAPLLPEFTALLERIGFTTTKSGTVLFYIKDAFAESNKYNPTPESFANISCLQALQVFWHCLTHQEPPFLHMPQSWSASRHSAVDFLSWQLEDVVEGVGCGE